MIFARCADFHLTDKLQRDREGEREREGRVREREEGEKNETFDEPDDKCAKALKRLRQGEASQLREYSMRGV